MEICGGQTHSIMKYGLDQVLEGFVNFIHGPGCPVCVTPESKIDAAISIAQHPQVILCTYGDMLRVPGSRGTLMHAKASGFDIRVLHGPMDALNLAKKFPDREIVFFAVGFETTAPAHAMLLHLARAQGVCNISMIVSQVLVPPALRSLLGEKTCEIDGLLAAGHVCTITGFHEYHSLAEEFSLPIVVTGFEPVDILEGVSRCLQMLEQGQVQVANQYARSVSEKGNLLAQRLIQEVFTVSDSIWRGLGTLPRSGLSLSEAYWIFDAERRFKTDYSVEPCRSPCRASQVLKGSMKPNQCPHFGTSCTPEHPIGAPMVSTEGACAAYHRYRNARREEEFL